MEIKRIILLALWCVLLSAFFGRYPPPGSMDFMVALFWLVVIGLFAVSGFATWLLGKLKPTQDARRSFYRWAMVATLLSLPTWFGSQNGARIIDLIANVIMATAIVTLLIACRERRRLLSPIAGWWRNT